MQIPCWSVSIESVTRLRWGFCQVQSLLGHSQFLEPWFQTSSYQSCVALTWQSWWLGGVGFFLGSWYSDKHWPEPSRLGAIWNFGPCFLFYLSLITSQVLTKIPGLCEKYWTKIPSNKMQTRVLSKIESSNDLLLTIDWMYDLDWELDMENSLLTYELRPWLILVKCDMWVPFVLVVHGLSAFSAIWWPLWLLQLSDWENINAVGVTFFPLIRISIDYYRFFTTWGSLMILYHMHWVLDLFLIFQ